jgi:hypothetical protein
MQNGKPPSPSQNGYFRRNTPRLLHSRSLCIGPGWCVQGVVITSTNAPGQRRRRQADVLVPGAAGRRRTLPGRCARIRPYDPQTQGCEARRYAARAGALPSPFELSPETNTRLARQPRFPQTAPRHPQRGRYGARRRRGPARWRTSCSSAGRS